MLKPASFGTDPYVRTPMPGSGILNSVGNTVGNTLKSVAAPSIKPPTTIPGAGLFGTIADGMQTTMKTLIPGIGMFSKGASMRKQATPAMMMQGLRQMGGGLRAGFGAAKSQMGQAAGMAKNIAGIGSQVGNPVTGMVAGARGMAGAVPGAVDAGIRAGGQGFRQGMQQFGQGVQNVARNVWQNPYGRMATIGAGIGLGSMAVNRMGQGMMGVVPGMMGMNQQQQPMGPAAGMMAGAPGMMMMNKGAAFAGGLGLPGLAGLGLGSLAFATAIRRLQTGNFRAGVDSVKQPAGPAAMTFGESGTSMNKGASTMSTAEELFKAATAALEEKLFIPTVLQKLAERGYQASSAEEAAELLKTAQTIREGLLSGELSPIPAAVATQEHIKQASAAVEQDFLAFAPEIKIELDKVEDVVKEAACVAAWGTSKIVA